MLALIMSVRQPCQSCLKVVSPGCYKVGHYPAVRCEGKRHQLHYFLLCP